MCRICVQGRWGAMTRQRPGWSWIYSSNPATWGRCKENLKRCTIFCFCSGGHWTRWHLKEKWGWVNTKGRRGINLLFPFCSHICLFLIFILSEYHCLWPPVPFLFPSRLISHSSSNEHALPEEDSIGKQWAEASSLCRHKSRQAETGSAFLFILAANSEINMNLSLKSYQVTPSSPPLPAS